MEHGDDLHGVPEWAIEHCVREARDEGAPESLLDRSVGFRVAGNPPQRGIDREIEIRG